MNLQKQKIIFNKTLSRLANRQWQWHVLRPVALILLSVVVIGLAAYAQPAPEPAHVHTSAHRKSLSRRSAAPKTVANPTPAPTPAPAPASTATPAPAPAPKPVTPAAGTPKPEPVVTPSPGSSVTGLSPTSPSPSSPPPSGGSGGSGSGGSGSTTTGYTSLNWSGYLAANGTFTAVSALWTATMATGNGSSTSADSTWIGIGGVTSNDLIQVGTQNIISATGQVSTSAFYEMLPAASQTVPGVTVTEGDHMTASLSEIAVGQWTITITDTTDGQSWTTTVSYTSSLSSAEWIEEDPSYVSGKLIPFDNFNKAIFAAGLTTMNGTSVDISGSTAQPVTMVDQNGQPTAVPSAVGSDGASFTVSP